MMRLHHVVAILVAMLVVLLVASPAAAVEERMRHSGTIVDLDRATHRISVAEVGPWRVEHGNTVITTLVIDVLEDTPLTLVRRALATPSGFPGDFVEENLEPWDLFFFDHVTIDCLHKDGRLIALKITVLGPDIDTP